MCLYNQGPINPWPNIFGPLKGIYGQYLSNDILYSLYTHVK